MIWGAKALIYLTSVSDFVGTASKKVGMRLLSEAFYVFFYRSSVTIASYRDFYKHQNVNKDSFFVGLWHPIIIAGRKTKNPRFNWFVLVAMFYTKEINNIFISLGNVCNYNLSRIDEKFNLRYDEKKIDIEKVSFLSEYTDFAVLFTFFPWSQIFVHIISTKSPNNRQREVWYPFF